MLEGVSVSDETNIIHVIDGCI